MSEHSMQKQKTPVALVTGAAAGIGKATALAYAQAGCDVVVADVNGKGLREVAAQIETMGRQALACVTDVADTDSVRRLQDAILSRFGRLDYACNNAGIEGESALTADSSMENFDRVIAVNLRGVYLCLRAELQIMGPQKSGSIVNIASVAGLVGFAGLPAYCASKGAVVELTRAVAVEYATRGVRVNAVCPGVIKTDMVDRITGCDPQVEAQYAAMHPMNRMGTVEEVADTVVWLSLPGASFVTGQALAVDGGLVAR